MLEVSLGNPDYSEQRCSPIGKQKWFERGVRKHEAGCAVWSVAGDDSL